MVLVDLPLLVLVRHSDQQLQLVVEHELVVVHYFLVSLQGRAVSLNELFHVFNHFGMLYLQGMREFMRQESICARNICVLLAVFLLLLLSLLLFLGTPLRLTLWLCRRHLGFRVHIFQQVVRADVIDVRILIGDELIPRIYILGTRIQRHELALVVGFLSYRHCFSDGYLLLEPLIRQPYRTSRQIPQLRFPAFYIDEFAAGVFLEIARKLEEVSQLLVVQIDLQKYFAFEGFKIIREQRLDLGLLHEEVDPGHLIGIDAVLLRARHLLVLPVLIQLRENERRGQVIEFQTQSRLFVLAEVIYVINFGQGVLPVVFVVEHVVEIKLTQLILVLVHFLDDVTGLSIQPRVEHAQQFQLLLGHLVLSGAEIPLLGFYHDALLLPLVARGRQTPGVQLHKLVQGRFSVNSFLGFLVVSFL